MSAPISHAAMRHLGWERVDPRPWGKLSAQWDHVDGWHLRHCGHPTALTPWTLHAPDGTEVRAFNGKHWPTLRAAVEHAAQLIEKQPLVIAVWPLTELKPWSELTEEQQRTEARAARAAVGLGEAA
jgi:hypothetical protein